MRGKVYFLFALNGMRSVVLTRSSVASEETKQPSSISAVVEASCSSRTVPQRDTYRRSADTDKGSNCPHHLKHPQSEPQIAHPSGDLATALIHRA